MVASANLAVVDRSGETGPVVPFWCLFYLIAPGAIGFMLGWTGAGAAGGWPKPAAVLIWALLSILGWLTADLGTRVVAPLARPLGAPLALTLALGVIASGVVAVPLNFLIGELSSALGYPAPGLESLSRYSITRAVDGLIAPTLLWTGFNVALYRFAGVPRYGYTHDDAQPDDGTAAAPARSQPPFLQRVRPSCRGRVLALQAELHYVRVYTDRGKDLIHYRFGDAVAEAQASLDGLAVHRSWWVAREAVERFAGGDRPCLVLACGLSVPVSRAHRAEARRLAD